MAIGTAHIWRARNWSLVLPASAFVSALTGLMGWLDPWRGAMFLVAATFLWFLSGYLVRAQFGFSERSTDEPSTWVHRLLGTSAVVIVIASPWLVADSPWRVAMTTVLSAVISFLWGARYRSFVSSAESEPFLRALVLADDDQIPET